jgi:hypothetical protein
VVLVSLWLLSALPSWQLSVLTPCYCGSSKFSQTRGVTCPLWNSYQKAYFLPHLADGTFMPCFGLTGPHSGSDVTSLIGSHGEVMVDKKW